MNTPYTFIEEATKVAQKATCKRHRCGSIIVKDNEIIGKGYNGPPKNLENQRRCTKKKNEYHQKVTDKTCCIHAEHRAILNALKNNAEKVEGSTLYFMRVDTEGKKTYAGKPYCTICSKLALEAGIKTFVLLHEEGPTFYDTEEYNDLSYNYTE